MREKTFQRVGRFVRNTMTLLLVVGAISFVVVACGDSDAIEASEGDGDAPGVASATIVISDGKFNTGKLIVSSILATKLTIQNEDDVAYTFEIEELVTGKVVGAAGDTVVDFTSPSTGEYQATIAGPSGETEDTMTVEVE